MWEERLGLKALCFAIGSIKCEAFQNDHVMYRNAFILNYYFPWGLLDLDLAVFYQLLEVSDLAFATVPSLSLGQATVGGALSHIFHAICPPSCCPEGTSSTGCCGMGGIQAPQQESNDPVQEGISCPQGLLATWTSRNVTQSSLVLKWSLCRKTFWMQNLHHLNLFARFLRLFCTAMAKHSPLSWPNYSCICALLLPYWKLVTRGKYPKP